MKKTVFVLAVAAGALVAASAALAGGRTTAAHPKLTIVHVQKGCHSFSVHGKKVVSSRVRIARGHALTVLNQDIDGHKLVQLAGPAKLRLPALKMNDRGVVKFTKAGVYRIATKSFEMEGMPEVETGGPDHRLSITVVVY